MAMNRRFISVIVCAHNEEKYIDASLFNIVKALQNMPDRSEVLLIADRCTDRTVQKAKKYPVRIIEKTWKSWRNSYSEALQLGYKNAQGSYVSIIDADIVVPPNFFEDMLPFLKNGVASVAAHVETYPDSFLNALMNAWEKTYSFAPMGRTPYGAARVILKKALDVIGGFRDIPTPDTDMDIRLMKHGYKSVVNKNVRVYHIRRITLKSIINGQINSGRGRYALGISLPRTIGHAILRVRPFTLCGWLMEKYQSQRNQMIFTKAMTETLGKR
ncbi:MAG: glycosyltransferase [Candidatus Bathyarchaeia archaeon]